MKPKLIALLVGINDYPQSIYLDNGSVYFPVLHGPVNDSQKIKDYIATLSDDYDLNIVELYNGQATKSNIVNAFIRHLGNAKENDAVLFYFSGHGTQEKAASYFESETDGKIESFVCHYNQETSDDCLFSDKELRYLIHKVSKSNPHVTIIIDCCHSGDMTRNAAIVNANYPVSVEKRTSGYTFPQREWHKFIFQSAFKPEDLQNNFNKYLPEGRHILFSASESNESAFEINREGVFTKHLLACLNYMGGRLSNQSLFNRIAQYMRYAYVQKPRIYSPTNANDLKASGFLNLKGYFSRSSAEIVYNPKKGWTVNRGGLNGIYKGSNIDSFDPSNPTEMIKGEIVDVQIDNAVLKLFHDIDPSKVLIANTEHFSKKIVRIFLSLDDAIPKDSSALMDQMQSVPVSECQIVLDENDADYTLQHYLGKYYLTKPFDRFRPISKVSIIENSTEVIQQIKHLSAWHFIYEIENKDNPLPQQYLQVEYSFGGNVPETIKDTDIISTIELKDWINVNDLPSTTLQLKLVNNSAQDLYVALLYMDINYGSETFLLEPSPYFLPSKSSINISSENDINLQVKLYKSALYYNRDFYTERFKIIFSTTPFEVEVLRLVPLSDPPLPGEGFPMGAQGGIGRPTVKQGWSVKDINIKFLNPLFNNIRAGLLKEMLDDKCTSAFAQALYYQTDPSNPFSGSLVLRPEINLSE